MPRTVPHTHARTAPMLVAIAVAVLPPSAPAHAQSGNAHVQSTIPYSGHLDRDGAPAQGTVDLAFSLFTAPTGGTALWTETHTAVPLSAGRFSVVLGSRTAIPVSVFQQPELHVQVSVAGAVVGRQRIHATPYALRSNNGVPLGTILDWHPFDGTVAVPDGFVVCDGSVINDPQSPFNGRATPNLTDARFTMGVPRNQVGGTGGRNDIPTDGAHAHGGGTGTYLDWIPGHVNWTVTQGFDSPWHHRHSIASDGAHGHGGENRPRFLGVVKIMRVR